MAKEGRTSYSKQDGAAYREGGKIKVEQRFGQCHFEARGKQCYEATSFPTKNKIPGAKRGKMSPASQCVALFLH